MKKNFRDSAISSEDLDSAIASRIELAFKEHQSTLNSVVNSAVRDAMDSVLIPALRELREDILAGPDLRTGILGTCLCSLVQGGPKTMKFYNIFFVILWAIYKSKRTKTQDIEQINITNNMVKNDKLFPCFPLFLCTEITLSPVLPDAHTQTRTRAHTRRRGQKLVIAAPRIYQ